MGIIANRYVLDREIGRGASGSVWAAHDMQLDRLVAAKLLRRELLEHAGARARFEEEARNIARLRSPHVVQVFDAGADGPQPFIVMELLDGESLEARLNRYSPLPRQVALSIAVDVARGIEAIHGAGMVHRDLKPANILLTLEGGREVAKVVDFGVSRLAARELGSDVPVESSVVGTPLYLSPEALSGSRVDHRSDLWALGIVTYRMLTGAWPFHDPNERIVAPGKLALIDASVRVPELGALGDAFFRKALAEAKEERFQTASEFAAELSRIVKGDGVRVTRLLFLDDEPDMEFLVRRRFREELRSGSYEICFAADGNAGLRELQKQPDFDVVLTDLNMPGMDGLTFLEHVGQINPLVRVVVVSAYSDMTNIRMAMNRGAFDFLVKPIDFRDMQRTIEKCAKHVELLRAAHQHHREVAALRNLLCDADDNEALLGIPERSALPSVVQASVVALQARGLGDSYPMAEPGPVLERLNAYLEVSVREIHTAAGFVVYANGAWVVAVFFGQEHLRRSIEACLSIRDRLRDAPALAGTLGVSVGLDSGNIILGRLAGRGMAELAALGEAMTNAFDLCRLARRDDILVLPLTRSALAATHVFSTDEERSLSLDAEPCPISQVIGKQRKPVEPVELGVLEATISKPLANVAR
jgi:eukaryotic-like serine/threonine-protein kinase